MSQYTAQEIMAKARFLIRKKHPYYSAMLNTMAFVPGDVDTMATTASAVCVFNKAFVEKYTYKQIAGVIVHEMHHLLNKHHIRCRTGAYNGHVYNYASDCEINDDLVHVWELPDAATLPESFGLPDGKTAEWYYPHIDKAAKKNSNKCGGCAGNPDKNESRYDNAENGAKTKEQIEIARTSVANEVIKTKAGTVPAGLRVWAETQITAPSIHWTSKLRKYVRSTAERVAGQADYSWQRRNRRSDSLRAAGHAVALAPGMDAPVPNVMVAVDTSASMGTAEAKDALGEVAGIIAACRNRVTYMSFDCRAYKIVKVHSMSEVTKSTFGGGGTNFLPVFAAVDAMKVKPTLLVICTDGDGEYPAVKPTGYDVVWVLCGKRAISIPWGENISVFAPE